MRALFRLFCLTVIHGPVLFAADGWETLAPMPEGLVGMVSFKTSEGDIAYQGGSGWKNGEKFLTAEGWKLRGGDWLPLPPLPHPIAFAPFARDEERVLSVSGLDGESLSQTVFRLSIESRNEPLATPGITPTSPAWGGGRGGSRARYPPAGWLADNAERRGLQPGGLAL